MYEVKTVNIYKSGNSHNSYKLYTKAAQKIMGVIPECNELYPCLVFSPFLGDANWHLLQDGIW